MSRMKHAWAALITCLLATPVAAQTGADYGDDQLLEAVKDATEAEDADLVLALMLEVRERGLLMFQELGQCEIAYPQTEFFDNSIFRGAATWAYNTEVWEMAIAQNHCGCHYDLWAFDDFIQSVIGRSADTLAIDDYNQIRNYRRDEWKDVSRAYTAFRDNTCGG